MRGSKSSIMLPSNEYIQSAFWLNIYCIHVLTCMCVYINIDEFTVHLTVP